MAKRLKDKSGIDPLSIDQEGGTPRYFSALNDPVWTAANKMKIDGSSVFIKGNEFLVSNMYKGGVDLTVFHPSERLLQSRPDWLYPGRRQHYVPARRIGASRPALVRATRLGDHNGVPIDQTFVKNAGGALLLLPPGRYVIGVETAIAGFKPLYHETIY